MYPCGRTRVRRLGKPILFIGIFILAVNQLSAIISFHILDNSNNKFQSNTKLRRQDYHTDSHAVQMALDPVFADDHKNNNNNNNNKMVDEFNDKFYTYEPREFWKQVSGLVSDVALYPSEFNVSIVLNKLATGKITSVQIFAKVGTCLKWLMELEGGKRVLFKPQLATPKEEENKQCNSGHEQGVFEVASFHLLRLLGSRAVPFVAGRKVNIATEILPLAPQDLKDTIELHENGTACIVHKCQYCDKERHFCFPDGIVRGSMSFWVTQPLGGYLMNDNKGGYYQYGGLVKNSSDYSLNSQRRCDVVRATRLYNVTRYYMDLFDMIIFDHVIGNLDRKHTYIMDDTRQPRLTILLDHGQAFCHDESTNRILVAFKQCCRVRRRTIEAMRRRIPTLKSDFIDETKQDQLHPLLEEYQLDNVLQRMENVLELVKQCLDVVPESVVYNDID